MTDIGAVNSNLIEAAINNAKLSEGINVAVAAKAKDLQEQQGQSIISLIDSAVQKVDFKA